MHPVTITLSPSEAPSPQLHFGFSPFSHSGIFAAAAAMLVAAVVMHLRFPAANSLAHPHHSL
jgi:hypothetical protein